MRVAVAHTLKNAKHIMDELKAGKSPYDFIEVMACPGGCQGGGGQPRNTTNARRAERMKALYEIDKNLPVRKSHENPEVVHIYKEFLGAPLEGKAHELLHTHFHKAEKLYDFTGAGK